MTWKNGRKLIDARRERVAQLRLRGLTAREIVAALEGQGFINAETGKPYGLGTIGRDFDALNEQWRASAGRSIEEHKAEQAAQINEVIRAAWATKKLDTVLKAEERRAKLLGLDAPTRISGPDGGAIPITMIEVIKAKDGK